MFWFQSILRLDATAFAVLLGHRRRDIAREGWPGLASPLGGSVLRGAIRFATLLGCSYRLERNNEIQWRSVADQIRSKVPKLAAIMDEAETDVLAYITFPRVHRVQLHSTNPIEGVNGQIKCRTEVVGIFRNDEAIIRLVGAILLEQNDVYGPPPSCKGLSIDDDVPGACCRVSGLVCDDLAAGPDGIRGSAARQMDELAF